MNEFIDMIQDKSGFLSLVLILIGSLVEISPIKINPISWFGKLLNKDVLTKVQDLQNDFENHKIESQRFEILSFANSCMNHGKHTKEEFDHIISVHDTYDKYIKEHNLQNGQVDIAYKFIIEMYYNCLKDDNFL